MGLVWSRERRHRRDAAMAELNRAMSGGGGILSCSAMQLDDKDLEALCTRIHQYMRHKIVVAPRLALPELPESSTHRCWQSTYKLPLAAMLLGRNSFGAAGLSALNRMLLLVECTKLVLSQNAIGNNVAELRALPASLRELRLDLCGLQAQCMEKLGSILPHELHTLSLCGNPLRDQGFGLLLGALGHRPNLRVLRIDDAAITDFGVRHFCLAVKLGEIDALEELRLAGNLISGNGIDYLSDVLRPGLTLRILDLSRNRIVEGSSIARLIVQSTSLRMLDVRGNPKFGPESLNQLVVALGFNSTLQELLLPLANGDGGNLQRLVMRNRVLESTLRLNLIDESYMPTLPPAQDSTPVHMSSIRNMPPWVRGSHSTSKRKKSFKDPESHSKRHCSNSSLQANVNVITSLEYNRTLCSRHLVRRKSDTFLAARSNCCLSRSSSLSPRRLKFAAKRLFCGNQKSVATTPCNDIVSEQLRATSTIETNGACSVVSVAGESIAFDSDAKGETKADMLAG